jgi:hypothetical protein
VNRLARDHGLGVALVIGIILLVIGVVWQRPDALFAGIIFAVIGVIGRPLQEFTMGRNGVLLKWQQEAAERISRRLEDRITITDTVEVQVTRGTGDVKAYPGAATGVGGANDATTKTGGFSAAALIVRPQSPDEFAETVVDKVIAPALQTIELPLLDSQPKVMGGDSPGGAEG